MKLSQNLANLAACYPSKYIPSLEINRRWPGKEGRFPRRSRDNVASTIDGSISR